MNRETLPSDVRTRFDIPRNSSFAPLGSAGGFSGAKFWQVETIEETYCLRRWPKEHPSPEQLDWIHRVLLHCVQNGCPQAETILKSANGSTVVSSGGFLWQLSQWMPGKANYNTFPNDEKLTNAITTLAKFHLAAAQVSLDFRTSDATQSRLRMLANINETIAQIQVSRVSIASEPLNHLRQYLSATAKDSAAQIFSELMPFKSTILPIQPVIRDIWHDHVFFTGNEVTGIVDFGAMTMDTVCLDLSRLIGSLVDDDSKKWQMALETYSRIRALTEPECRIIRLLDRSGVLLGGINWLKWIFVEQRHFDDFSAVEKRIQYLLQRMIDDR